jgi:NADH dehydrogenase [ubiquinone] 1 alpha subcomplex assembly factor 1
MRVLFRFDVDAIAQAWFAVDDRIMGGASQSRMRQDHDCAVFEGDLSLAGGGGFASVRSRPTDLGDASASAYAIVVRGDGHRYKLALRTDDAFDGVQYAAAFMAPTCQWREVLLTLAAFRPTFRGREVPGAPPLDPASVRQAGFVIADRQAGPFALAVRSLSTR